jgi:hypothetical protein
MLSDSELRQAVRALTVIGEQGNSDEFAHVLHQANGKAPAANPWANMTVGASLRAKAIAGQAAALLGVPQTACEAAALEVFGASRQRAVFNAILSYAAELTRGNTDPEPERTLLDTFNEIGLDEMLALGCVRDYPEPEIRHSPEYGKRPAVRIVAGGENK